MAAKLERKERRKQIQQSVNKQIRTRKAKEARVNKSN